MADLKEAPASYEWQHYAFDPEFKEHKQRFLLDFAKRTGQEWLNEDTFYELWLKRIAWRIKNLAKWWGKAIGIIDNSDQKEAQRFMNEEGAKFPSEYLERLQLSKDIQKVEEFLTKGRGRSLEEFLGSRGILERWACAYTTDWIMQIGKLKPRYYWGTKMLYYWGLDVKTIKWNKEKLGTFEFPGLGGEHSKGYYEQCAINPEGYLIRRSGEKKPDSNIYEKCLLGEWKRTIRQAEEYLEAGDMLTHENLKEALEKVCSIHITRTLREGSS